MRFVKNISTPKSLWIGREEGEVLCWRPAFARLRLGKRPTDLAQSQPSHGRRRCKRFSSIIAERCACTADKLTADNADDSDIERKSKSSFRFYPGYPRF